jgi:hypothetical protein
MSGARPLANVGRRMIAVHAHDDAQNANKLLHARGAERLGLAELLPRGCASPTRSPLPEPRRRGACG